MTITHLKKGSLREITPQVATPITTPTKCRIRAKNDVEAVERWLDEYFDKPTTYRTYKKEAERFLVWCAKARTTNLSCLNRDDVEAYIEFLKNPTPKEVWCGPRRKKQSHGDTTWYPFAGPLSESAIKTALASLNSLMSYLVDAHYIDINPFALVRRKSRFKQHIEEQGIRIHERILHNDEWEAIVDVITNESDQSEVDQFKKERLKFLVSILFFLGLRIDELARATWVDCKKLNGKWWFFVRGKGDRLGKIPVNSELLHKIMHYRHSLKKAPLPDAADTSPLIFGLGDEAGALSVRQMSNLLKEVAIKAAHRFAVGSESYQKLQRFSPHWLRHLSASRQDLAGISFTNIRSNLRHQNAQTTRLYVHAQDDNRHKEMEKLTFVSP